MSSIFNLPDVGEGLTEAEILSWKVGPGSPVQINDVLVEIETAKSVVELPSPFAGTVEKIIAEEGATVEVGAPLVSVTVTASADGAEPEPEADTTGAAPGRDLPADDADSTTTVAEKEADSLAAQAAPAKGDADKAAASGNTSEGEGSDEQTAALVGSGPKADPVKRRARKRRSSGGAAPGGIEESDPVPGSTTQPSEKLLTQILNRAPLQGGTFGSGIAERARKLAEEGRGALKRFPGRAADQPMAQAEAHRTVGSEPPRRPALAKPPVRKAAKDLGLDLADVPATGSNGQVTQKDLVNYAAHAQDVESHKPSNFWVEQGSPADRIERVPVKGVRKATAKAMVKSAFEAPHVSIFVDVDASRTMEFVKRLKSSPTFEGVKVTPLLILAKAVIWATARNPQVNSQWTDSEILIKRFINLGIAAATPRGLMVPNIKDAQDLSLRELAVALNALTKTAREGKTQPGDMSGGTLTITNIGALGIDTGTPIINPGEAAILAFGTIKQKPWVVDGEVIPRWVTTLGGSFDHRIVDGDLSARFMADVASVLEEPALLLDM
ncbi:MAG: 2-oxo acid dehydrogenase subunit E2 [Kocuria sp.]|nr:2-oxo acid dehydrogenase subunit E2 [Kocuria sp.]